MLRAHRIARGTRPPPEPRHVEIPVRYGGEFGPDLGDVARHTGLTRRARRGTARGGGVPGLLRRLLHLLSLSGRTAAGIGHPAPVGAAQTCAGGQRRHRRSAGRHLSAGLPRRLAADRPHPTEAVRPFRLAAAAAAHGRPRALRPGTGGARCEPHSRDRARLPDHGAGPGPLRLRAFRNLGIRRGRPAGVARRQSAGGQCGECRRARDDADRRRVRLRGRRRDCAHRRGFRRRPCRCGSPWKSAPAKPCAADPRATERAVTSRCAADSMYRW